MISSFWNSSLLSLAFAVLVGILLARLAKVFKLPAVTGYLVAGILIGPYCLGALGNLLGLEGIGFTTAENVKQFDIISQAALGFIAFSIGTEFRLSEIKHIGKKATVIAFTQALAATLFVDAALILFAIAAPDVLSIPAAIVLGAIATATAPAATLMVVRQYKAKGPMTNMLLPIVALDDAIGLVVFSISYGIAKTIAQGNFDMVAILLNPILEVVFSIGMGALLGFLLTKTCKLFSSRSNRVILAIGFVILAVALSFFKFKLGSLTFSFSSLLTCMMLGTIFCNTCKDQQDVMARTDTWTEPLFVVFFVVSGAELELDVFGNVMIILIGVVYIIARSAGKYLGTFFGAKALKCEPQITKYLGITLLPQAGVALGMSLSVIADGTLGAHGALVRNIVLFAVLIYELVGPLLTKIVLVKAGEIVPKDLIATSAAELAVEPDLQKTDE